MDHRRDMPPLRASIASPAIAACILVGSAAADEPQVDHGESVRLTAAKLEEMHLTHRPLDDALSAEWLAEFIRQLDPRRMYFLQSDLDEFGVFSDRLDDLARAADFTFAETVRDRYRQRVAEATTTIEELLAEEPDFGIQETVSSEYTEYAADSDGMRERWRKRIKWERLIEKLHGRATDETTHQLRARYTRIASHAREMTDERLCTIYLTAIANRYDSRSYIMSESFFSLFTNTVRLYSYTLGLGIQEHDGRHIIQAVSPEVVQNPQDSDLIGWELMAIVSSDGQIHDIVHLHPEDVTEMVFSVFGALSTETQVTLELLHPVTLERRTLSWYRFQR